MAMNRVQFRKGISLSESFEQFGAEAQCQTVCSAGVTDVGFMGEPTFVGNRNPKPLPIFRWVNTVLGDLTTSFGGAYHAVGCSNDAERYLRSAACRFNRSCDLRALAGPAGRGGGRFRSVSAADPFC
jgi:hypothetical protein